MPDNHAAWNATRDQIMQGAVKLTQGVNDAEAMVNRASEAGAALAAEVYRYMENPADVGMDALHDAYQEFMGLHSGNFHG
jgi:hypothetical protein